MSERWWQRTRCTYCARSLTRPSGMARTAATRDHVHPVSRGGREKVPCCRQCNGLKDNMSPDEWAAFMVLFPRWWDDARFRHGHVAVRYRVECRAHVQAQVDTVTGSALVQAVLEQFPGATVARVTLKGENR